MTLRVIHLFIVGGGGGGNGSVGSIQQVAGIGSSIAGGSAEGSHCNNAGLPPTISCGGTHPPSNCGTPETTMLTGLRAAIDAIPLVLCFW